MEARYVALAEIARPHGVRGEVRLRVYNKDSDLLLECTDVRLTLADGTIKDVRVESARPANEAILMRIKGYADRDQVLLLQGAKVSIPRDMFPPLEDGEFYVCDVIGAKAWLAEEELGAVIDIRSYPTMDVVVIKTARGTYEVPLMDAYVGAISPERIEILSLEDLEPG